MGGKGQTDHLMLLTWSHVVGIFIFIEESNFSRRHHAHISPSCDQRSVAEKDVKEFCKQCLSGLHPCLSWETGTEGQIRVCSRVIAGDVATPPPRDAHHVDAEQAQRFHGSPSHHHSLQ